MVRIGTCEKLARADDDPCYGSMRESQWQPLSYGVRDHRLSEKSWECGTRAGQADTVVDVALNLDLGGLAKGLKKISEPTLSLL